MILYYVQSVYIVHERNAPAPMCAMFLIYTAIDLRTNEA